MGATLSLVSDIEVELQTLRLETLVRKSDLWLRAFVLDLGEARFGRRRGPLVLASLRQVVRQHS